jgi:hypothetical protein
MHERAPLPQLRRDGVLRKMRQLVVAQVVGALVFRRPALAPIFQRDPGLPTAFYGPDELFQKSCFLRGRFDLIVFQQLLRAVERLHDAVAPVRERIRAARLPFFQKRRRFFDGGIEVRRLRRGVGVRLQVREPAEPGEERAEVVRLDAHFRQRGQLVGALPVRLLKIAAQRLLPEFAFVAVVDARLKARREAGGKRVIPQDARAKRMDRANKAARQGIERLLHERLLSSAEFAASAAKLPVEPLVHLARRLARERDGREVAERHALPDERHDAGDERGRLAGAGGGVHDEVGAGREVA